tara:strand:+ start:1454 stop:2233 length:780 start_codon:yes stop_codon:yes gene_type:complete
MKNEELKVIAESLIDTTKKAGKKTIELQKAGLKVIKKPDNSPVTNGDIEVDKMLKEKIKELTPNIPIVSEESVDLTKKNTFKTYWLLDPIDGTKEYIAGKDVYTLNAGLIINYLPAIGIIGVPKKDRLFFSFGKSNSYLLENDKKTKLDCKKKTSKNKIFALTNRKKPPEEVSKLLNKFGAKKYEKLSSSYKYCLIANGEYDLYIDKVRAHEWDDAAGHAIAEHAGAIVTDMNGKFFKYGKEDYKNPTILIRRSLDLNV